MSKFLPIIFFAAFILGISLNLATGQNNSTANGGEGGNVSKVEDPAIPGAVSFSDQPAPTPNELDNLFNFKHLDPAKEAEELMRQKEEVLAKNLTNDKDFNAEKEKPKEMDKPPLVIPPSQNDKIIQIHVRFILRGKKVDVDPNEPSEERFLKTMYLIEAVKGPPGGCKLLIFDTRTLCKDWPLGRILMGDGGNLLVLGTKDGQNKWAASKKICGQQEIEEVYEEIGEMRARNGKMQKVLSRRENEIKNVLYEKFVDEELSKYSRQNWEQAAKKSTKGPKEPGFWEAMFG